MARRRKKNFWRSVPLWACAAALIGWGLWQANEFRLSMQAEIPATLQETQATTDSAAEQDVATQAAVAVAGDSTTRQVAVDDNPTLVTVSAALQNYHIIPPKPQFDESLSAEQLAATGKRFLDEGRIVDGRAALNGALGRAVDPALAAKLREILTGLNSSIFLGSAVLPDDPLAHFVEIMPGDSFLRIGHEFGLTGDFVEILNPSLKATNLKVFTGVKIVEGPFRIRLARGESRIDLFAKDMYVCSFQADLPEGNYLPKGEYRVSTGSKLQMGTPARTWIGFEGCDLANQDITGGWIYGAAGPRGNSSRDHATGIHLGENDLRLLYNVLVEFRSTIRVEP